MRAKPLTSSGGIWHGNGAPALSSSERMTPITPCYGGTQYDIIQANGRNGNRIVMYGDNLNGVDPEVLREGEKPKMTSSRGIRKIKVLQGMPALSRSG